MLLTHSQPPQMIYNYLPQFTKHYHSVILSQAEFLDPATPLKNFLLQSSLDGIFAHNRVGHLLFNMR